MQAWVDQLARCKDEESFVTTYNSFLDTWQALEGLQQRTGDFPYQKPTDAETRRAYYMKNRTLLLHNQIVWGEGADEDRPVIPRQGEQSHQQRPTRGAASSVQPPGKKGKSGDHEEDDPNERKSDANPPSKGDEAQDKEKKKEAQEATSEGGEQKEKTAAEIERDEALGKVKNLRQQLKEAEEAARKAADDKARKTGEELAQEIDDDKARQEKKRESKREKKRRKKQKKDGQEGPPSDDEGESDDSDEKEEEEEKKPEGESEEKGDKPATDKDKKPEGDEKSKDESKPEGEDQKIEGDSKPKGEESITKEKESEKTEEGPPKDEEPAETWAEVIRKARKPRHQMAAAEKAKARTYPRPMCGEDAKPNYAYKRVEHVPTKDPLYSDRWSVQDKPKDVPKRNSDQTRKGHCP